MALARFRRTDAVEGAEPEILELDENWLKRFPDDPYERIEDDAQPQQAAPTEPPAAPAKNAQPGTPADGEPASRRF